MGKLVVGFILCVLFIGSIGYVIYAIREEMIKKGQVKRFQKDIKNRGTKSVWVSVKDVEGYIRSLFQNPVYAPIVSKLTQLADLFGKIAAVIEKYPNTSNALRDIEYHVIPLMKKLLGDYETYMTSGISQSPNTREGCRVIMDGLDNIAVILTRSIDSSLAGNTVDLQAEVGALKEMFGERVN